MKIFYCLLTVLSLSIVSCDNQGAKDERLAKQSCSSCHAFPDPSLLDKKTWRDQVLPEMAFRMGLNKSQLSSLSFEDQNIIQQILPLQPMVSLENWERIKAYYNEKAPDSLVIPDRIINDTIRQFLAATVRLPIKRHQSVTLIKYDSLDKKIYLGTRPGTLYELTQKLEARDSTQLQSAPSKLTIDEGGNPVALVMGIMDPNEQALGHLTRVTDQSKDSNIIIDSLQRPVDFQKVDLDNDGIDDYVICNFGNFTGSLVAYRGSKNGKFKRYILQAAPGARKIEIRDFDGNGMPDVLALMAQGDERFIMLYNQGNFQFRIATLLRFNAVHGTSYFDMIDFNKDGKLDILYTNGDNADYSTILKPYHGVHILLNTGTNEFKESWFYPMHGASQARASDFDQDGDVDIAAISFFPDFEKHPEHSLVYFENTADGLRPQITPVARKGRWITMEIADYDTDGDTDILLGSLAFPTLIPEALFKSWQKDEASVLVLKNSLR